MDELSLVGLCPAEGLRSGAILRLAKVRSWRGTHDLG